MYYPNDIEDICYEENHMRLVLTEIKANFSDYFQRFIETEDGIISNPESIVKLSEHFGTQLRKTNKDKDMPKRFKNVISENINEFERDRKSYLDFLDKESLEEYKDDPSFFKNTILRNQCPIIRVTLQNKRAKELDKFRKDFSVSDPKKLLEVAQNLSEFAQRYVKEVYDSESYESIQNIEGMGLSKLLDEEYIVYGVIGGGIRSHFLYKLNPDVFPYRSRDSIWALWYLTSKKTFGCKEDSEFLMIDTKKSITQQNYFYPYDIFAFYALQIYLLLKREGDKQQVDIDTSYRYIIVDAFVSFVAQCHAEEIGFLKEQVKEDSHGY